MNRAANPVVSFKYRSNKDYFLLLPFFPSPITFSRLVFLLFFFFFFFITYAYIIVA